MRVKMIKVISFRNERALVAAQKSLIVMMV